MKLAVARRSQGTRFQNKIVCGVFGFAPLHDPELRAVKAVSRPTILAWATIDGSSQIIQIPARNVSKTSGRLSFHGNDDLALRTSCFDMRECIIGLVEREDALHHGAQATSLDKQGDLFKLFAVRSHEEK